MSDLAFWALVWLLSAGWIVVRHWRAGRGVGLVLGYVISFGALHWLANALNLLPWNPHRHTDIIGRGMQQSALAMLMFAVGAELALVARRRWLGPEVHPADEDIATNPTAVNVYFASGLILQMVLLPLGQGLPSITALLASGSTLTTTALGLKCWNAYCDRQPGRLAGWLAVSASLPLFTVATQGFLGYGFAAMLMVMVFMAASVGPRLRLVAAGLAFAYLGLSVYVTYMRDRDDIRSLVWSGSALDDRMASLRDSVLAFEWFDLTSPEHLSRIDIRLNQNYLVGAAVERLETGHVAFADGQTLVDALRGLLPRALFPDKGVVAGSGDLVSIFTGMRFGPNTSVGIGQVMECYVNFGTSGVLVGFLLLGLATSVVDGAARRALVGGDVRRFTMWYVPGCALLNLGGSLVEVTSTAAAGLAMAALVGTWAGYRHVPRPDVPLVPQPPTESPEGSR